VKKRILIHCAYLLIAAIAATTVAMVLLTYGMFERRVMEDLRVDARVVWAMLRSGARTQALTDLDDALRVTIVGADGTVIFDSRADEGGMESHADRPEIRRAMEHGEGSDIRNSRTVERNAFYYAVRMDEGRVLRVSKEASSIWSVYLRAVPLILIVLAAMFGMSMLAATAVTERLLRPIERIARGEEGGEEQQPVYPELRPLLSRIRSQHEEIIRSANVRVEFTANVSHELKTPLTSISGYAQLIESGMAEGAQARRFAGEIMRSANRLLDLINDIISLSHLDDPEQLICFEPTDLARAAQNAAAALEEAGRRAEVSLTLETVPAVVQADARLLEEMIGNLCDNAIRYNVRGGSVRVQVRAVRGHALLIVQDTGIGISRENQEKVFERFYRVDKSRSKATGGTGLGLAIVRHIAERHGAAIAMDSEPGRGTTITVTFDRVQ